MSLPKDWDPPKELKEKIEKRDKKCCYCRIPLKKWYSGKGKDKATIEHIENKPCVEEWNIALCCNSCNSSKGTKKLRDWLSSDYGKEKNIPQKSSKEIKEYIAKRKD